MRKFQYASLYTRIQSLNFNDGIEVENTYWRLRDVHFGTDASNLPLFWKDK